jgi:hypothetical protein
MKWENCNCNCMISNYAGVQQTNGKIVRCTMFGRSDCSADKIFSNKKFNRMFPPKNMGLFKSMIYYIKNL